MEITKGLVSMVTPCYNGEQFVHRLLDSVLSQTYDKIEHYVIDDGSSDNTKQVIESYIPLYRKKGYTLIYIFQDNSGQSVAINNGLKLIKGEFFCWPDSDDFYADANAIAELVFGLKDTDNSVSTVRSLLVFLDEKSLLETKKININQDFNEFLFEDCLLGNNGFWFIPGCYMCKTEILFDVLPEKEIYTDKDAGQNWQLMLPLFYNRKCITIKKYYYNVLLRNDSHSRGQYEGSLNMQLLKLRSREHTLLETLKRIHFENTIELKKYLMMAESDYLVKYFVNYLQYGRKIEARNVYKSMDNAEETIKIRYFLSYIPLGDIIFRCVMKLKNM